MSGYRCSVIIPVYNTAESALRRCLACLPPPETGAQILLVDDGSCRETAALLDRYRAPHILVMHGENRGVSAARNAGLDRAEGKTILFLDSDDAARDGFFTETCDFMEKLRLEVGVFDITLQPAGETQKTGYPENRVMSGRRLIRDDPSLFQSFDLCYSVRFAFDRAFVERNGLRFRTDMAISEDMVFNMRALAAADRAAALHRSFYEYWLDTEQSATRAPYKPAFRQSLAMEYEECLRLIDGDRRLREQLAAFYMDALFYALVRNQRAGGCLTYEEYCSLCDAPMFRENILLLGASHPCENQKAQLLYRLRYYRKYRLPYRAAMK